MSFITLFPITDDSTLYLQVTPWQQGPSMCFPTTDYSRSCHYILPSIVPKISTCSSHVESLTFPSISCGLPGFCVFEHQIPFAQNDHFQFLSLEDLPCVRRTRRILSVLNDAHIFTVAYIQYVNVCACICAQLVVFSFSQPTRLKFLQIQSQVLIFMFFLNFYSQFLAVSSTYRCSKMPALISKQMNRLYDLIIWYYEAKILCKLLPLKKTIVFALSHCYVITTVPI